MRVPVTSARRQYRRPALHAPAPAERRGWSTLARADTRVALAAFILLCFSTAPSGALFRWVTEDSWPHVYSIWGAGLLGVGLFALDVIGRAIAEPLSRSRSLLVAMAPPVAFLVWVALSAWWSVSPTGTPPQVVVLVMVTITAV